MPKIIVENCKGCGICEDACPNNAIRIENKKAVIKDDLCLGCEVCISSCPYGAITSDNLRRISPHHLHQPHPIAQYGYRSYPYHQSYFYQNHHPRHRKRRRGW